MMIRATDPNTSARVTRLEATVRRVTGNGTIGQINYASAKAALLGMTRSAARELAAYNIVVNAVAPAAATPMTENLRSNEKLNDYYLQRIPLKRWADPRRSPAPTSSSLPTRPTTWLVKCWRSMAVW